MVAEFLERISGFGLSDFLVFDLGLLAEIRPDRTSSVLDLLAETKPERKSLFLEGGFLSVLTGKPISMRASLMSK